MEKNNDLYDVLTENYGDDLNKIGEIIRGSIEALIAPFVEAVKKITEVIVDFAYEYPELTLAILANDDTEVDRLLGELEESMINQKFVEAEMEENENE